MIQDTRSSYEQYANNVVPGWKQIDKNKLCNLYVENINNKTLSQGYLSAIICKYWPSLSGYINKCYLNISDEELYDAFIEAILYALNKHRWLDEDSSLYGDPNGPDKSINIKLKYMIWNQEFSYSRMKRLINGEFSSSIDDPDMIEPGKECQDYNDLEIHSLVCDKFKSDDYVSALILHYIMFGDVLDNGLLNKKKLCKRLRNFDEVELHQIKNIYSLDEDVANNVYQYITDLSTRRLYNRIDLFIEKGRIQYAH